MALPVLAFFPWLVGLFASTLGAVFTWAVGFLALRYAARLALAVGMVLALAGITLAVSLTIKGMIYGAQMAMPASLGAATYFLPNNINTIIGVYVAMRVVWYLYHWTYDRVVAIARLTVGGV